MSAALVAVADTALAVAAVAVQGGAEWAPQPAAVTGSQERGNQASSRLISARTSLVLLPDKLDKFAAAQSQMGRHSTA